MAPAVITIRRGLEVVAVHDMKLAQAYLLGSNPAAPALYQSTVVDLQPCRSLPRCLLAEAGSASQMVLDRLVALFPLTGKARKNLGTALRAHCVRTGLGVLVTSAGDNLLTELHYISAAADAGRHLTPASIGVALAALPTAAAAGGHGQHGCVPPGQGTAVALSFIDSRWDSACGFYSIFVVCRLFRLGADHRCALPGVHGSCAGP